jgi:cytochrome c oxidase subunit I+III
MLALQACLVAIALIMAAWLVARRAAGLLARPQSGAVDVVALFLAYSAAEGAVTALVTRLPVTGA